MWKQCITVVLVAGLSLGLAACNDDKKSSSAGKTHRDYLNKNKHLSEEDYRSERLKAMNKGMKK